MFCPAPMFVRVWCAFGRRGWFVMKQEEWPDNLSHFGDWSEQVRGFFPYSRLVKTVRRVADVPPMEISARRVA
jgi:hypothetical protein